MRQMGERTRPDFMSYLGTDVHGWLVDVIVLVAFDRIRHQR